MDNFDIKDKSLAEGGRRRIKWAEREMPVLGHRGRDAGHLREGHDDPEQQRDPRQ